MSDGILWARPTTKKAAEQVREDLQIIMEEPVQPTPAPALTTITPVSGRLALKGVALSTSLVCATASVYFSGKWFLDSQPGWMAWLMSLSVVATLTVAPELSRALWKLRHYALALVVAGIASIAMIFSMSSTVGGIYNERTVKIVAEYQARASSVEGYAEAQLAKDKIARNDVAISRLQLQVQADQATFDEYSALITQAIAAGEHPETRKNTILAGNRNAAATRLAAARAELSQLEKDNAELLPLTVLAVQDRIEERQDFNSWLGGQFGITKERMEFIMAVFPAIFIDVIAPSMLMVAFSL